MSHINYWAPITIYRSANTTEGNQSTLTDFMRMGQQIEPLQTNYRAMKQEAASCVDTEEAKRIDASAKRYKATHFPAATISGVFATHRRSKDTLLYHSGWMCIDIDDHFYAQDATGTKREYSQSLDDVPSKLMDLPWVAYAAHSVGGVGYFALIPLEQMPLPGMGISDSHEWYFDCLSQEFAQMGISIDPACRDVTRLRFCSYDPAPIVRRPPSDTETYHGIMGFESKQARKARLADEARHAELVRRSAERAMTDREWSFKNMEVLCDQMEQLHVNLCESYEDWRSMGCSLASHFGEEGRGFFHRISSMSGKYNASNTDRFYNSFIRTVSGSVKDGKNPITISTAYKMFAAAHINFKPNR